MIRVIQVFEVKLERLVDARVILEPINLRQWIAVHIAIEYDSFAFLLKHFAIEKLYLRRIFMIFKIFLLSYSLF